MHSLIFSPHCWSAFAKLTSSLSNLSAKHSDHRPPGCQGFLFVSISGWNQSGHFSTIDPLVSTAAKDRKICRILFTTNWAAKMQESFKKNCQIFSKKGGFNQQKLPTVSKIKGVSSNAPWPIINDCHHPILLVFLVLATMCLSRVV